MTDHLNTQPAATVSTGETSIWQGRTHWKVLFVPVIIELFLLALHFAALRWLPTNTGLPWWDDWGQLGAHVLLLLLGIWYAVVPVLQWRAATFSVTSRRVIARWGLLYRQSREIPLDRVVSVSVERGILDRIFRCGTLIFHDAAAGFGPQTQGTWNTSNGGSGGVRFSDVPRVLAVQDMINQQRFTKPAEGAAS
ncbi:PH domain-containing protein [Leucobacter sp. HY1910]